LKAREIHDDKTWAKESIKVVQRKQDLERQAKFNFLNILFGKEGFKDVPLLKTTLVHKFWKHGETAVMLKTIRDQLKKLLERVWSNCQERSNK
jgi:hypothetical protein